MDMSQFFFNKLGSTYFIKKNFGGFCMVVLENFPNVTLVKFDKIDEVDLAFFEKAIERFIKKVGADAKLQLALKDYAKGGLRVQHELHGTLSIGAKKFYASAEGWKLFEVVSDVLAKLIKETEKEVKKEIKKGKE